MSNNTLKRTNPEDFKKYILSRVLVDEKTGCWNFSKNSER
jgi:hypothetical protein